MNRRLVYPQRKRCGTCRGFFGFMVLAGLWCSHECAGHPPPSAEAADWPREHYVPLGWHGQRGRRAKQVFDSEQEAERTARQMGKDPYLCSYCLSWHIGKSRSGDLSGSLQGEDET